MVRNLKFDKKCMSLQVKYVCRCTNLLKEDLASVVQLVSGALFLQILIYHIAWEPSQERTEFFPDQHGLTGYSL